MLCAATLCARVVAAIGACGAAVLAWRSGSVHLLLQGSFEALQRLQTFLLLEQVAATLVHV